jgi:hypothetical protein
MILEGPVADVASTMDATRHVGTVAPEPAELIARARTMIPSLAKRSLEGRRQRRVLDETIADMQRAGFFSRPAAEALGRLRDGSRHLL